MPRTAQQGDRVYDFTGRRNTNSQRLYQQIADRLLKQLAESRATEPLILPQERELASQFDVSRSTIRQALSLLEQLGLVQRKRGQGTRLLRPAREALEIWKLRTKSMMFIYAGPSFIRENSGFYGQILSGVLAEARERKLIIKIKHFGTNLREQNRPEDLLPEDEDVAGVMICGSAEDHLFRAFAENGLATVAIDYWPRDNLCDAVTVDVEAEAFQAAAYLSRLGHRAVGFAAFGRRKPGENLVRFDPDVWRFLAHLRRAVGEYGLVIRDEWITTVPGTDATAQRALDRFFSLGPLPEAIICFDHDVAAVALDAIKRRGLKCPDDISIIARGIEQWTNPTITTLRSDPAAMGRVAVRLLIERVFQKRTWPMRVAVASKLIPGESCSPPKSLRTRRNDREPSPRQEQTFA